MDEQGLEEKQSVNSQNHPSGIVPTIINIVSTVNLDCKLDLQSIKLQAPTAEYNPQRHPAVIMRIRAPESKAQINSFGMMVCTGAKSESQSKLAASKYAAIIRKMGFPTKFKDFKIQEIVGSCDVKFPIHLERLANSHAACSSYNPVLFPWLIYEMKQPKIVLYIFDSGKIHLKGSKSRDEIYTAFENIYPVLTEFRKNQQCHLKDISVDIIGTDDILKYLVHRAIHLRRLRLLVCKEISDKGLREFVKFSLLEKIEILYFNNISKDTLEVIGQCCPLLNSLILVRTFFYPWVKFYDEAFAIAKTMSGLRHLKLSHLLVNNAVFLAILDGCCLLESLHLGDCHCRYLSPSLEKRCNEQLKDFRRPNYSLYDRLLYDVDDEEE